jgi:hypothetical protein
MDDVDLGAGPIGAESVGKGDALFYFTPRGGSDFRYDSFVYVWNISMGAELSRKHFCREDGWR